MNLVRKYLNYLIFGVIVLLVVGLAIGHSRHMRSLVDGMASGNPELEKASAAELIKDEQFMDAITGEPAATRIKAARALKELGNDKAVKQCIAFLKDPDKPVQDTIVQTLQAIGANSPASIKELVAGLKDGDANVQKGTIAALSDSANGVGPKPGVVAAIIALMKAEGGARNNGGTVLGSQIFVKNGANTESLPLLTAQLQDKDEGVRGGAAAALGKIGDPNAVVALKTAMHSDTAQVRRISVGSLALIAAPSCEDALTEAINNTDDDSEARSQAAAGLGRIGSATAIATLIKALNDDDNNLRSSAITSLSLAGRPTVDGPYAEPVVTALITALKSPIENIQLGAAKALQPLNAPETNAALIETLHASNIQIRVAAATALGFKDNRAAVAPLISALSDTAGEVNTAARDALSAIGPAATDALIITIQKGGPEAYYAAQSLTLQGSEALPALQKAALNPNPVVQKWVAVVLGDMGSIEGRPTLQQLQKSSDPDVAYAAQQQLDRIARTQ